MATGSYTTSWDVTEGKPDKNVFDIQQGVSIIIAVKKKDGGKGLAEVMHGDLWGARAAKYGALEVAGLTENVFSKLENTEPQYPFVPRDYLVLDKYSDGFSVRDLMLVNSVGMVTSRDALTIDEDRNTLWSRVKDFASLEEGKAREKYSIKKDVRDWRIAWAQADLNKSLSDQHIIPLGYRPFDQRWTYFTGRSRGFICFPRTDVMRHLIERENVALLVKRQAKLDFSYAFVTSMAVEGCMFESAYANNSVLPLYLYPNEQDLEQTRRVNFDPKLYKRLQGLAKHPEHGTPDEVQVFDYIYGVLHCPAYRETYAEFLKIDFPRIPWPATLEAFWDISAKGEALRKLHLMDAATIGPTPYPFDGQGDNVVDKPEYREGRVWINKTQYFADVPEVSWGFYIGGYQPAQKWLKDRKGRTLSFDDMKHYQRIIKILSETDRIMQTITMDLSGGTVTSEGD